VIISRAIFSFSRCRRASLTPISRSPGAGEGTFHHFIVLRTPESIPFVILALSGRRRAPLTPISRSPGAGEPTFCHFGTLPKPESLPYTNFLLSRPGRASLSPFGRSPRLGEPTKPTPTHLPKPEVGLADDYSRANRCRELVFCKSTTFFRTRQTTPNFAALSLKKGGEYALCKFCRYHRLLTSKVRCCRVGEFEMESLPLGAMCNRSHSSSHKREVPIGRGGW
jgi:hypothetical protein